MKTPEELAEEKYSDCLVNDDFQKYVNTCLKKAFIEGYLKASETLYSWEEILEMIEEIKVKLSKK
jgi:hypothetical protein